VSEPIVLAADASAAAGLGHLSRCTALACALGARGTNVRTLALGAEHAVEMDGLRWDPASATELASNDLAALVLDSYALSGGDRSDLAEAAPLAQFDDRGDDVAGDLVIGPLSADADEVGRIAGPRYACLRRALWGARLPYERHGLRRVLVTTGGGDPKGDALRYALSVRSALPDDIAVVWAAPADAHPAPPGVQRLARQPSLTDAMLASDLVVCGAGVTMLEAASLGLPCIAIPLAENQRAGWDRLAAAGAIVPAKDEDDVAAGVARIAAAPQERRALADRAAALVDGFGAFRVAARVEALVAAREGRCYAGAVQWRADRRSQ
jgi:UDP-2,4-diacetamido-2,4,6-trideoxy-beta-L-altropyranose hydrolase